MKNAVTTCFLRSGSSRCGRLRGSSDDLALLQRLSYVESDHTSVFIDFPDNIE